MTEHGPDSAVRSLLQVLRNQHRNIDLLNDALQVLAASGSAASEPVAELLTDDDPEVRMYAALALGEMKSRSGVPALIAHIDDSDVNVRYHVVEALAKIGAPEAVTELLDIAQSGDFFLAFPAIDALARLQDPQIAARLVPLLGNEIVRAAVVEALGSTGDANVVQPIVALLDRPGPHVNAVAQALTSLHTRYETQFSEGSYIVDLVRNFAPTGASRILIDALNPADSGRLRPLVKVLTWFNTDEATEALTRLLGAPEVRKEVIEALVRHGKDVTRALTRELTNEDIDVRRAAVFALGRIGDGRSVQALVRVLYEDAELAAPAANALGRIGDARAYDALIKLIGHDNPVVRQAVIAAVNSLGDARTERDILALTSDENPHVRESALRICGYFGFPECGPVLFESLNDSDENVRRAAIDSLPFLPHPDIPKLLLRVLKEEAPKLRAAAAQALGSVEDPLVIPGLITALKDDEDSWVRYYSARSLGRLRAPDAAVVLIRKLKSDTAMHVRIAAADAIAAIGGSKAASSLSSVLAAADRDLSSAAAKALAAVSHPDALPPLLDILRRGDRTRRLDTIDALRTRSDPEVLESLKEIAIRESDPELVTAAVGALGASTSKEGIAIVMQLSADPRLREMCIAELAKIDHHYLGTIAAGLSHPESAVRRAIVEVLARRKHPEASQLLAQALSDEQASVRLSAVAALSQLGSHAAERRLAFIASNDPDAAVRAAAREAFGP